MDISPDILATLTDDGDTAELPDGRTLRLRVQPDEYASIMDEQGEGMWCGRLEWVRGSRDWYPTRYPRPDGFTGAAEVIDRDNGCALWWEVPADLRGAANTENRAKLRGVIMDHVNYGYRIVTVEVLNGEDHYGRPIVTDAASLGGVEPFPAREYIVELVGELVGELDGAS